MGTFKISLANQYSKRSKYQPYLFMAFGFIYFSMGLYRESGNETFGIITKWIWIITGIFFILFGFVSRKNSMSSILEINDNNIKTDLPLSKGIKIPWENLSQIHIKPISLEFELKDGTRKEISLGNVAYKDVMKTKEVLNKFAKEKNITVN